jgi:hypothetical protein
MDGYLPLISAAVLFSSYFAYGKPRNESDAHVTTQPFSYSLYMTFRVCNQISHVANKGSGIIA